MLFDSSPARNKIAFATSFVVVADSTSGAVCSAWTGCSVASAARSRRHWFVDVARLVSTAEASALVGCVRGRRGEELRTAGEDGVAPDRRVLEAPGRVLGGAELALSARCSHR